MSYDSKKKEYQNKMDTIRKETQQESKKLLVKLLFSFFLLIVFPLLGIAALFFLVLPSVKKLSNTGQRMKEEVGQDIIQDIMGELFDSYEFLPECRLSDEIIHSVAIPGLTDYNTVSGNDYTKGVFHGLNFLMSDIHLTDVHEYTDAEGNERSEVKERFNGLWFVCDFAKQIDSTITVSPRTRFSLKKGIALESEQFCRKMLVESDSEHDVFYVLTPSLMEHILTSMEQMKCRMYFCFTQQGQVHILADRGNALEVDMASEQAEQLHEQFSQQLRQVTDIIDQLRLSEAYH